MAEPSRRDRGERSRKGDDRPTPWRVEGDRPERKTGGDDQRPGLRWPGGRGIWLFLLGLVLLNIVASTVFTQEPERTDVSYTFFREQVEDGNVVEVNSRGDIIQGDFRRAVDPPGDEDDGSVGEFETVRPAFAEDDGLYQQLEEQDVLIDASQVESGRSFILDFLLFFGPTLLIFGVLIWFFRRRRPPARRGGRTR